MSTQQPGFDPYAYPTSDDADVRDAPPAGVVRDAFGHPGGSQYVPPRPTPVSRFGYPSDRPAVGGTYGQPTYGQTTYGQAGYSPTYGQPTYGQPTYGRPPAAQPYGGVPVYSGSAYGPAGAPRSDLAGWGRRFVALNIDSLIMLVPYLAAYVIAIATAPPADPYGEQPLTPVGGFVIFLGFAWFLGSWIVSRVVLQGRTGQSWGKRVVGIRLVGQQSGLPIGAARSFAREIAHNVDGFFYLGYLWPLWDAHRQTFADKILTTVVVRD